MRILQDYEINIIELILVSTILQTKINTLNNYITFYALTENHSFKVEKCDVRFTGSVL